MMQRLVDNVLGVAKESLKTFSQESFNQTVRVINGFSALVLAVLPSQASLEGIQGWELRPKLRAPRLLSWMEDGVSSFNSFIHDYDSDDELYYDESEYESECEDSLAPSSPCSTTSHVSRASSFGKHHRHSGLWKRFFRLVFWPLRIWGSEATTPAATPRSYRETGRSSTSVSLQRMYRGMKDYMMPKPSVDRRKGVIEDMQFWVELLIERMFETMRMLIHYSLSPLSTLKLFISWLFFQNRNDGPDELVDTSTLGDSNPVLQKQVRRQQSLNTDGRTCEDVITALGYPYEALRVTTEDGHILLLERIPRPSSQKVLYLQHGMFDSSLGWVSNGVVGSQAFAAFDQGYDVFLGNFRGLASREHVNPNISARSYWHYTANEHGTQDIPAMLTRIHELKMGELQHIPPSNQQPYSLCGVAHSLGGASILMYVVTRRLESKPHHLSHLILLSPAGFHEEAPPFCWIMKYLFPIISPILQPIFPGLYIPTRFFRGLFNKLARDFQNYPAVGGLVQTFISSFTGGDHSNWVGVLGMSHYNMNDMPGLSFLVAQHLAQMMRKKRFTMFDFGSRQANFAAYGTPEPLDIGAHYGAIDIPVDLVAGRKDTVVPRSMVRKHYQTLKRAGCKASYDEFDYAHLDFTFSHKEEIQAYVMSRLLLVTSPRERKSFKKPKIVVPESAVFEDKEITAGSVATRSHEESVLEPERFQEPESIQKPESFNDTRESIQEPESFDDTSFFAFPSKEVVSIISRQVSRSGVSSTDVVTRGFDVKTSKPSQ